MRITGYILIIAALLVTVVLLGWRMKPHAHRTRNALAAQLPTTHVARGALTVTLAANGVLESAVETPVRSEVAGNLVELRENSAPVKPGEVVYRLNSKEYEDRHVEQERALSEAMESLNTLKTDSEVRIAQVTSDVAIAEEAYAMAETRVKVELEKIKAQVDFAESELTRAETELSRNKRLAALNYIPGTRLRDAEQAYHKKQFELAQQRTQLHDAEKRTTEDLRDQQHALNLVRLSLASTKASTEQSLEDARIRIAETQRRVDEARTRIEQCTVTAPVSGLVVVGTNTENWPERRPYRLGDQVNVRTAPVIIYDLNQMRVRCQIGEMDIDRVQVGQLVHITASTQRERRYRGKIAVVEELAREANVWQGGTPGKRVFGVLITLDETDPTNLRPGMTVDMEIVLESVPDTLTVPIRAVFPDGDRSIVYRVGDKGVEAVPVITGTRNDLQIAITGKLQEGEIISLDRVQLQTSAKKREVRLPGTGEQSVVSARVDRGDLRYSVSVTGVVGAKRSIPVVPEISGRIQWICNDAIKVTPGAMLMQLETRQSRDSLLNLEARLDEVTRRLQRVTDVGDANNRQSRLSVTRARDSAEAFKRQNEVTLEQSLRQIEYRENELEERRKNLEVKRRLAARGLLAGSEVERDEVGLRSAEFALERERRNYQLQKTQLDTAASNRDKQVTDLERSGMFSRMRTSRDIRGAKIEMENLQLQVERARADLSKMTVKAPASGLVMLSMRSSRGNARPPTVGDWVSQGRDIATIVSLDQLQVHLELDQSQITGITMNQQASLTIEALAGTQLQGKVASIGQTARRPPVQGWTGISAYTTFPVIIDLPPDRHSPVRPGMRAGVTLIVRTVPNVLMVPNECLFTQHGKPTVFVERNGTYTRVEVEVGESNGEHTVISRGLAEGEKVSLHDISAMIGAASTKGSRK